MQVSIALLFRTKLDPRKTKPIFVKTISNLRKTISNLFQIMLLIVFTPRNPQIFNSRSQHKNWAVEAGKNTLRATKKDGAFPRTRQGEAPSDCSIFLKAII